jgi:1,4-alpha-glucan branching enzyme
MAARKETSTARQSKKVSFAISVPQASKVLLAGTFNNWDYKSTPLRKTKDSMWKRDLALEPGRYEYKFVVDGNWITDPNNNNRVHNSLGAENSVIEVR